MTPLCLQAKEILSICKSVLVESARISSQSIQKER